MLNGDAVEHVAEAAIHQSAPSGLASGAGKL